jgi:hypothetical protein
LLLRRIAYALLVAGSLATVVLLVAFNVVNLREIHDGAPSFHAHTPRMKRWTHPLPVLLAVDSVAVLIVAWSVHLLCRRKHTTL